MRTGLAKRAWGVDAGDIDQDGDLDLFVTNYQLENNGLYRNDGSFYSEISFKAGLGDLSLNYLGFGTGFFDSDNDGYLDLFVGNGHVHDNIEQYGRIGDLRTTSTALSQWGRGRLPRSDR